MFVKACKLTFERSQKHFLIVTSPGTPYHQVLRYLDSMSNMPPPPRSARPTKRPLVEEHIGADATDEEWTPQKSTSKSPAPPKSKAAKTSPSATKVKQGHTLITTQIKTYYLSERDHPPLSGRWFQEKTKQPEFWRDLKKYTAASTLKHRFSVSVSVDDIAPPTSVPKPVIQRKGTMPRSPIVDTTTANAAAADSTTIQLCQDCGAESSEGRLTCDSCLAQADDGFADTIVYKAEAKAEDELHERPFGAKDDPIKVEDEVKCDESENEEEKVLKSPSVAGDDLPTLITLDDGSQYVMVNGTLKAVKSAVKMGLEK